ncbi:MULTISPECIES: hypothetical protein [unclassified Geodermatophilus]
MAAYRELGTARDDFQSAPSGRAFGLCQAAQDALDALLDLRLSLTAAIAPTAAAPA